MILTCPACATSYFIRDDLVGPNGRKVRCQSCGEVWRAGIEEPLELTAEPEAAAAAQPSPTSVAAPEPASLAETPAPELPKAFRARAEQQRRLRRAAAQGAVWAAMAAVFVGLLASAWLFRVEVVRAFPRAAAAYAMVGAPVNPVGLDFEAMSAREAPDRPGMVLVAGALRNVRDEEIVAPPVRVALLDEHGAEVGFKIIPIDAAPVLPGKVQGFAALIPDPGGHAADIGVDFAPAPAPRPKVEPSAKPHGAAAPEASGHGAAHHAPAQATGALQTADASTDRAPPASPEASPANAQTRGLRPAAAPGFDGAAAAPVDAKPLSAVDSAHREAVSASHHG